MKKWLRNFWRKANNRCTLCDTKLTDVFSPGMGMYDPETVSYSYCSNCSKKDDDFLLLYDLLEKGVK